MSANLTLKFKLAEKAFRQASTPQDELRCLETMLSELPKHKGTDKMQADIKSRISRLKKQLSARQPGDQRTSNRIPRQGAGRAVILGGPNSGKSQLVASLTNAEPEIAPYPFTTRTPQPAMMPWEDVFIQLIDTPPVTGDFFDPDVQTLVRSADVVVLLLDLGSDEGGDQLNELLQQVAVSKTRLHRETFINSEEIGVTYTKTLFAPNKIDLPESEDRRAFFREIVPDPFQTYPISALTEEGLVGLCAAIYQALDVVRVYTKLPSSKEPDMEKPFTVPRGSTLLDVAPLIHKDFASSLRFARVWGSQVHDGTTVKADYVPNDGDIVELHV